jgi:hypothetical protein
MKERSRSLLGKTLAYRNCLVIVTVMAAFAAEGQVRGVTDDVGHEKILVSISGKHGEAVPVKRESLLLTVDDNSVPVQDVVSAKDTPLVFAVLVDLSRSNIDKFKFERQATLDIFTKMSKKGEGYFGYFTHGTSISARPVQAAEIEDFFSKVEPSGGSAVQDAIATACRDTLSRAKNPGTERRILFVISDGDDNQSQLTKQEVVKISQREGVPVFALVLAGAIASQGGEKLKNLARETGGTAIEASAPSQFADKLLTPLDNQYFLTLATPAAPQGRMRKLKIKSNEKAVQIAAPAEF